eukprot:12956700-Alexandrium_andersonii.AAC.1
MSASLVGSEMCIRDSGAAAYCVTLLAVCAKCANSALLEDAKQGLLLPMPVSYTHLTLPTICSV